MAPGASTPFRGTPHGEEPARRERTTTRGGPRRGGHPEGHRQAGSQTWLESLGEWAWPGQRPIEALPPAWVPARPATRPATPARSRPAPSAAPSLGARRLLVGALLSALAAVSIALALQGQLGFAGGGGVAPARFAPTAPPDLLPRPQLRRLSVAAAGSEIARASYRSAALRRQGSFYVYLPPGFRRQASAPPAGTAAAARYPVLYLLHGNSQRATAFLDIGLQEQLDRLISAHVIPPLIAVMIQGGGGANNWRNIHNQYYESYVLEAQEIVDRILPTLASRDARAIAGVSMGGYGAMEVALENPYRFGVVESWLGFFNGLGGQLQLDRHAIGTLGLTAFVYGGQQDTIADPSQNAPFAAALHAAGADAHSAVYPGEHSLATVRAHLPEMLAFAGRALARDGSAASRAPGISSARTAVPARG